MAGIVAVERRRHEAINLTYKRIGCVCGWQCVLPTQDWGSAQGKDILLDRYNEHKERRDRKEDKSGHAN